MSKKFLWAGFFLITILIGLVLYPTFSTDYSDRALSEKILLNQNYLLKEIDEKCPKNIDCPMAKKELLEGFNLAIDKTGGYQYIFLAATQIFI